MPRSEPISPTTRPSGWACEQKPDDAQPGLGAEGSEHFGVAGSLLGVASEHSPSFPYFDKCRNMENQVRRHRVKIKRSALSRPTPRPKRARLRGVGGNSVELIAD
jgi:hypothetical protein